MVDSILKVFVPTLVSFLVGIGITPAISAVIYRNKLWKKTAREDNAVEISEAYKKLHDPDKEKRTPRVGGVIIWMSVVITMGIAYLLSVIFTNEVTLKFNFFSINQTVILIGGLVVGAIVGLVDDLLQVGFLKADRVHGFSGKTFAGIVFILAVMSALWFFFKLEFSTVMIPFIGQFELGWWFIPFFIVTMMGVFSSGVIDGIDGLSGGVFAIIFAAYALIAYFQNQIDIATFSMVVTSGILAFLWFNTPPARFYMGETGMLGLTITLTFVAFLTHQEVMLLIIGFPLVATSLSSFMQITSKKYFGKKIFRVAPLHHHFQSLGWSGPKVVMRYWIITMVCAVLGLIIVIMNGLL